MRYGKLVGNTIDVVSDCENQPGPEFGEWVPCGGAGPGWTTVDKITFTPPVPPLPSVPSAITMRQARLVLFTAGLIGAVQTAINSLPSPDKEKAQIEWDYSNEVLRHNGFVATLGPALGLSDAQIDALFIAGAAL